MKKSLFEKAKEELKIMELSAPLNDLTIESVFIVGVGRQLISRERINFRCAARSISANNSVNTLECLLAMKTLSEGIKQSSKISTFKIIMFLLFSDKKINKILNKLHNSMIA